MITLKQFMLEKRKHNNDKISVYQELEKYKDRDDIYISFTRVNKIGINPKSDFNTPNGIYTYPLKLVWEEYGLENGLVDGETLDMKIPFGGDREFVQVIQLIDDSNVIKDITYDYRQQDLERDIDKLSKMVSSQNQDRFKSIIEEASDVDYEYEDDDEDNYYYNRNTSDFGQLWFITRAIAYDNYNFPEFKNTSITNRWRHILTKLGYDGVCDKNGEGIIHPSEPIQAVFLSIKPIKWIDSIRNKTYKNPPKADRLKYKNIKTFQKFINKNELLQKYNTKITKNVSMNESISSVSEIGDKTLHMNIYPRNTDMDNPLYTIYYTLQDKNNIRLTDNLIIQEQNIFENIDIFNDAINKLFNEIKDYINQ